MRANCYPWFHGPIICSVQLGLYGKGVCGMFGAVGVCAK